MRRPAVCLLVVLVQTSSALIGAVVLFVLVQLTRLMLGEIALLRTEYEMRELFDREYPAEYC